MGETTFKVYVTPEEKAQITANAKASRLSMSAYARALALGEHPPGALELNAVDQLFKVHANLGRLGGLLKMLRTNDERLEDIGREMGLATIDGTLADIRKTQAGLLELVDLTVAKTGRRG